MAKSLRSKWRRKCRAVKRIRYGQKELERLKKILGVKDEPENQMDLDGAPASTESSDAPAGPTEIDEEETEVVQVDKRTFNTKTLKDENGCYPVWMHPRKIRKQKRLQKKKKR